MIFTEEPEGFEPEFEIVSIFCEHDGRFILLHRNDHKPQGNTWGVPAGKVDNDEEIRKAMLRELQQETGIELNENQMKYFKKVFVRYPDYDFIYHIFHAKLDQRIDIEINHKEHKTFSWVSPSQALDMKLIQDLDKCIKMFYSDLPRT